MFSFWPRLAICVSFSCPCVCARSSALATDGKLRLQLVHLLIEQRDLRPRRIAELLLLGKLRLDGGAALLVRHRARGRVLRLLLQRHRAARRARGSAPPASQDRTASPRWCPCSPAPSCRARRSGAASRQAAPAHRRAGGGVAKLPARLGKLRRDRRGLLLRGIGAAGRRREILLQPLHPRRAGACLQRGIGQLLRQPVALRAQRVAVGAGTLRLRPAARQAAATACRVPRWPPPVRG